jgi:ATP-dependent Zn protease
MSKFVIENGILKAYRGRDSRVAAEMEHYYAQTKQLIIDNRSKLDKLTARLIEEKTLLGDQVQEII